MILWQRYSLKWKLPIHSVIMKEDTKTELFFFRIAYPKKHKWNRLLFSSGQKNRTQRLISTHTNSYSWTKHQEFAWAQEADRQVTVRNISQGILSATVLCLYPLKSKESIISTSSDWITFGFSNWNTSGIKKEESRRSGTCL